MSEYGPPTSDNQPTGPVPDPMQVPMDEPPLAPDPASAPTQTPPTQQMTSELPPAYGAPGYQPPGYPPTGYPQSGYPTTGAPPGALPPSYQASAYGYPAQPTRTDDKAIWALVSSIAGFVFCPIILHVVGWVLANQSLRSIRESQGSLTGDGVAKAARILGIVGIVFYGVGALLAFLALVIFVPLGLFAAGTASEQIDLGSDTVVPAEVSEIDGSTFTHDAGDLTYDLTDVDFDGADATMAVELGAGTLVVDVPADVTVTVDAQVGAGQIDLFGERTDGIDLNESMTSPGAGDGTLDLDLGVTVGELEVSRG